MSLGNRHGSTLAEDEYQLLARLMCLGCTVWVGTPAPGKAEFTRPNGWQGLDPGGNEDRLRDYMERRDCLAVNTGLPVAVVDVDTRNGGDIEKMRALLAERGVRIFAEVDTPGGGKHFYVAGHPDLVTTHSNKDNQKLPDYPGVDIQSFRCNVFLPGTLRPKHGGHGYTIVYDEIDQLALLGPGDDGGAQALADWVAEQRARNVRQKAGKTKAEWTWDPCEPWAGGTPDKRQQAYLDKALADEADKVAQTADGGRNDALFAAALKCGSYIAGAGLDEQRVIAALRAASDTNGLTADDGEFSTNATIRSGLRCGKSNPKAVPPPQENGSRFFGRSGLHARDLADEVMASVPCGFGYPDQRFYTYDSGVWTLNAGRIEAEIARLLGNRYRSSHTHNVLDLIRYSPNTAVIADTPLAEYVNVPNGMVEWKTGKLLAHSPDYRSTVQLPVDYNPGATCPLFEKFITEVLPKDLYEKTGNSPGFIWELIGYTIYSGNPLHVAILLYGKGRNGKGTLIRVLKALLGEHNCSTVGLHQLLENRFRAATLHRKLANLAGDLDSKWLDSTAMFKAITGGDTVQAENKYAAPFDFTPWALPFYSINKPFGSADSSEGWLTRWVVVPFPTSFSGREDRALDVKLQTDAELGGILARGIEALPALMARGRFTEPDSLQEAKHAFMIASDAIRAWLDECCALEFDEWTPRTELYRAYCWHTACDGSKTLSAREFYNRLEQVSGIRSAKRSGERGFAGIQLLQGAGLRAAAGWHS